MRYLCVPFAVLLVCFWIVACQGENATSLGKEVLNTSCTSCHSNLITCNNLGKSRGYWQDTVDRMVKKGMNITDQEEKAVIDYLSGLEPGASPVCD